MAIPTICSIPDCGKPTKARGLCAGHYHRLKRHGDPLGGGSPLRPQGMSLDELVAMHLRKSRLDENGCWIAQCAIGGPGYPMVSFGDKRHNLCRLVLEQKLGRPLRPGTTPTSEITRHTCDVRPCINPDHLVPGSFLDNTRDMDERGRRKVKVSRGEDSGNAKVTEADVLEIRRLYEERPGYGRKRWIAKRFGISEGHVGQIIHRRAWRHI